MKKALDAIGMAALVTISATLFAAVLNLATAIVTLWVVSQ